VTPNDERSLPTLRDYLGAVRRWIWLVVACAVLAPVTAVFLSLRTPALYEASAQVLVKRQNLAFELQQVNDPTAFDATRLLNTQAQLARVPTVARRTVRAAGVKRDASELLGASSVTAQPASDFLTFTVRDHIPAVAARLATEYARQFTLYQTEVANSSLTNALHSVEARLSALHPTDKSGEALYASLVQTREQLRTLQTLQTSSAELVREAGGAGKIEPNPSRAGSVGAVLGIVLGLTFALLAEALDTRVRKEEQIGRALGLPLLGRFPKPPSKLGNANRLVTLESPLGADAEAFRMLAGNLKFTTHDSSIKTIMVTSALAAEGKTTTLANLGAVIARQGRRVTLVDLDLQSPQLDRFFGLSGRPGLTDVVLGEIPLEQAIVRVNVGVPEESRRLEDPRTNVLSLAGQTNGHPQDAMPAFLEILPIGRPPPNAAEFAGLEGVARILESVKARSDLVLIDTPPLLLSGAGVALTAEVDAILIVARLKVLRIQALADLRRVLDACPARKLGFVVTGARRADTYGSGGLYGRVQHSGVDTLFQIPEATMRQR
jgi:succinoglycan biosynthesis transport protein ExoP